MQLENSTIAPSERRTHILVECPELIASVRVGVLDPLAPGNGQLFDLRFARTIDIKRADLAWADILVTVRGCELITLRIVEEAKRLGKMAIYYLDDDLLNLPEESVCYVYFRDNKQDQTLKSILGCCDALWGVNTKIRDQYLPLCGKPRWLWNRIPTTIAVPSQQVLPGTVQILYAGSVDHEKNIRAILTPAIKNVCARLGNRVHFTFVGANPGIANNPHVTFHSFFEDYDAYRTFVRDGNFTVALAVVQTGDFYQCKYFNKFVEYTAIGAVGIYTDCELYRQVIRDGENGLLCENTTEGWQTAIERLVEDGELRSRCLRNAQALIQKDFHPEQVFTHLLSQLPELASYRAPACQALSVRLPSLRWLLFRDRITNLFSQYKLWAIPVIGYKAAKKLCKFVRKVFSHVS